MKVFKTFLSTLLVICIIACTASCGKTQPESVTETTSALTETAAETTALTVTETSAPTTTAVSTTKPLVPTTARTSYPKGQKAAQAEIDKIAKKYGAVGISAVYFKNGKVIDTYAYGEARKGTLPMTADSKMRIASISKVLTGAAAHLAAQEGKFDLDKDIGKYLGIKIKTKHPEDVVTARSILTHSSSIAPFEGFPRDIESVRERLESDEATRNVKSGSPNLWLYNNYAFSVLGMAVERAENRTLDQILNQYIYAPLNIDAAFYGSYIKNKNLLVDIYHSNGTMGLSHTEAAEMKGYRYPGKAGDSFAGGVTISAYDLGKIFAMFANDGVYDGKRCLSPDIITALEKHSNRTFADGFCQAQPLRYRKNIYNQSEIYYHTGNAYGAYNLASYNPATKSGVIVLTSGAQKTKDKYGIYAVCSEISDIIYNS